MTKVKLWISDIDGTIMNYDRTYTPLMKKTIDDVQKSNTKFVLATGRMFDGAQFAADMFNLDTPVVCYQGAVVRTKDEILWRMPVDNNLTREIIEYLRKRKIHTHIYNDDVLYVEDDDKKIMHDYCYGRGTKYTVLDSFDDLKLGLVAKILCVIQDEKLMAEIKTDLTKKYQGQLKIVQSSPIYLEINDVGASKGEALNFLKEYWNLSTDEVLASGDQDNDIEMLKNAGIKVCVGSNSAQLAKIADYYCKNVDSDELPKLIRKLILCE